MSPEQAAGELDQLGPKSDVYSLGATLFCLLTGRAPFTRDDGEDIVQLLQAVRRGDLRPPRHWKPSTDRALEAVCQKAMALAPADRYGSPRALAEDVERWMADEPVSAYPEPRHRRLARWARRHAPLVAGTGALLTTAVVALTSSTWLISREKSRVEAARSALAISNRALADEKDRVEAARKDAESGYDMARDTVDRMFRDIAFGRLVNNPQTNKIRVELADEALTIYRQFAARRPDDPDVKLALARAEGQAADRHRMVGEFDPARNGYIAAIGILKDLCKRYPGKPDYLRRYAYVEDQFGQLFWMNGRHAEAEPHSREAVRIAGELGRLAPNDPIFASLEALTLMDLARWAALTDHHDEAERLRRRAVERARVVAARFVANRAEGLSPGDRYLLPMALSGHGASLLRLGRTTDAEAVFSEVIGVYRADLKAHPGNNDTEYLLADALNDLGKTLTSAPARRGEALAAEDEAIGLMARLIDRFPEVAAYPPIRAEFRAGRGLTRTDAGQFDGARDDLEAAHRFFADQAERSKDIAAPLQQLGRITGDLARLAARQGRLDEARGLYQRAIEAQERALALAPGSAPDKDLLARHRADLKSLSIR
jgi:tetratricopeptide (TPR) repeat protein